LRQILALAIQHARLSKLLDYKYGQEQGWRQLLFALYELHQRVWNTINRIEPYVAPTELYAETCWIQEKFLGYRAAHYPEESVGSIVSDEGPSNGHMADEVELFERLMSHVKELMAITLA
jgi:hypothetical protein